MFSNMILIVNICILKKVNLFLASLVSIKQRDTNDFYEYVMPTDHDACIIQALDVIITSCDVIEITRKTPLLAAITEKTYIMI